ncbi:peptidase S8 and S53 subtilisin kexin sedolisin [Candidatus Epulonipiscium fishelsonii]|uniref:Peptidase S8 and S53 subtilisin kexin sedolisin n=1 Tax=Candidatus Epulonipiscium fishelsonii TaxID=77094 RepID=A0ACC8XFN4_9FIRM|nr:peptidase S8 and S53 subtilisin kexin sedolisin [Epulopiscium sp. SCG-B11WGA-EpuloA1]ONI43275.1 peptidase S8 and S53 subtilisin kexin sedolisin [Epulopiscium sp. SCG-B05WGA-EpuloA1]ONI47706.1 peptidase S8 and S53 subtilisin kexin sedolisin [Epulopiscium sp. SCG-C06WGA-EpuloA1]
MDNKIDATLQILSSLSSSEIEEATDYLQVYGFEASNNIDIIVKYNGDINKVAEDEGGIAQIINSRYAVISISRQRVDNLMRYTQVEYMEAPKLLNYNLDKSMQISCIKTVQNNRPFELKGKGVLLGIIDSGIQYAHRDFINPDGTTRIEAIWDQSINGSPPEGFKMGTIYTKEQINYALRQPNRYARLAVVPSEDTNGHGTHVAGIAGGNGRASNGTYVGAAPEADFLIVKLGIPGKEEALVRNVEIMLAIKFIIEYAKKLQRPVAINISNGMNEGPHDGRALIEAFIDDVSEEWKTNIIIGAGNEGGGNTHTSGLISPDRIHFFEFQVGENQRSYALYLWKNFIDTFEFEIVSPSGARTPRIRYSQGARQYVLQRTKIYTTFAGPSPLNGDEEFAVFLRSMDNRFINEGVWRIEIFGIDVVDGRYDVWGPSKAKAGDNTFMLEPTPNTTLTTPSTARNGITVGAYNSVTGQIASFSGQGYVRNDILVKPDLVAPGVDIVSTSVTGGYIAMSGTSMAAPHVTGGVALLMEWGIVQKNNPFLYGENLKTYLLRGTDKNINKMVIPDPLWGYGKMCIKNSLDILRKQQFLG